MQINAHSARTFSTPRSRNWRKPRACLICPNTGSTILLPQPVPASPTRPFELSSHGLGEWPADLALGLVGVFGAARGDVGGNAALLERSKVRLTQVAAVGGGFFGLVPEVLLDPVDERYELAVVAHAGRQAMCDDDLRGAVNGGLVRSSRI